MSPLLTVLHVPLALLASGSLPRPATLVPRDGQVLAGFVQAEEFHVPAGTTVWVESDLVIRASKLVRIEGSLIAFDADALERQHAPSIDIGCTLAVDVPGRILGGHGRDGGPQTSAGNGSSIRLGAPISYVDGWIQSGDGGRGAPGGEGGRGGHLTVDGYALVRDEWDSHVSLTSGRGGEGGFPSGNGGESGACVAAVSEDVLSTIASLMPAISAALAVSEDPPFEPPPGGACPNGTVGGKGANASTPDGADGADGADGTETSPPTKGGNGRKPGDATASDGLAGNNGLDCCPGAGGNGGAGGKGGNATAGKGGKGGRGGNSFGAQAGGAGGDGGDGGSAKAGRGGNGGHGGKAAGAGGASGMPGSASAGQGGAGGSGGTGSPNGPNGTPGSGGGITEGGEGTAGNSGGACP